MTAASPAASTPATTEGTAPVLVYGLGRSGVAVAELLVRQGRRVIAYDRTSGSDDARRLQALGVDVTDEPLPLAAERGVTVCIAAPGVPIDHPDLRALRSAGVETIGEIEWVYRTVPGTYVGITGTAGKGSVTRWLADTLAAAGLPAVAGGNIDPALSAVAEPGRLHVVEMSSFGLERVRDFRPRVAVILNLGVDHLDRHGDVRTYHAAKRNLLNNLTHDDAFVYNRDDPTLRAWAAATPARPLGFSLAGQADAWLDGGRLELYGRTVARTDELAVTGAHQYANGLAVALAASALGVEDASIAAGLRAFQGLSGRYNVVGTIGGVRFIEDSIATRNLSVRAALEATPAPVVWIGGGQDKGADWEGLEALVRERVALFVGIGASGAAFAKRASEWTETVVVDEPDGRAALRAACRVGFERLEGTGGAVLLAPLAASFDQFRDYVARAEAFRAAVALLEEEVSWIPSSC